MENYAQYVKIKLLESIKSLESLKRMYVKHTDEDFIGSPFCVRFVLCVP